MEDSKKETLEIDYCLDNFPHVNYPIKVEYSEVDQVYLARTSFESLITHGDSPEEALEEMKALLNFVQMDIEDTAPLSLSLSENEINEIERIYNEEVNEVNKEILDIFKRF